ncbi:MAG TPA: DUF924 domain-containing protein [Cyanobacteria bacterium UBA11149]|nr:DUF924 domain-containing protein [Cyanobacteria bacterium UBA11367]HBE60095.1 DUF924 domain-containing protein [Cyanobacteria bacterium UBA11366]HBK62670.1 DUF924 domain-containing protein [Cyanobacteria bacterium UBA11166]HBR73220.1 DUF924 domain-containing protein [Cyanobacteria bacterium UBA11159]HBS71625.1 DUF924 domain-containing protein [Cyanobacteria bacterium UBA11153]HBW90801.1 DUF924 domain-containing protein [Cyanobacteria bacterium UBA11149]HCA97709.1 DUF924 domain-containing p
MSQQQEIIEFWFGKVDEPEYGKPRQVWFTKNPEFDEEVRSRFMTDYQEAASGKLERWKDSALSCLALIIVLDQFPRNMFRDRPEAFATDSHALDVGKHAVACGFDRDLLPLQRWFIYLPFEHSENLEDQYQSVNLFSTLQDDPQSKLSIKYAYRHLEVIERFGRFPHRNRILGRETTPEEAEFLQQPGSSF